jgi:hypothetical protein
METVAIVVEVALVRVPWLAALSKVSATEAGASDAGASASP